MPRHAKQYADLAAEEARLQDLRVNAFRTFAEDVRDRKYPETRHEVHVDKEVLVAAKTLV